MAVSSVAGLVQAKVAALGDLLPDDPPMSTLRRTRCRQLMPNGSDSQDRLPSIPSAMGLQVRVRPFRRNAAISADYGQAPPDAFGLGGRLDGSIHLAIDLSFLVPYS